MIKWEYTIVRKFSYLKNRRVQMTQEMYGRLLKEIRLSRKMTLHTLSSDIISVSQLSKFENGITNLTIDRLLLLLDKLNVTYEEFFTEAKAYQRPEIERVSALISKKYIEQDVEALKTLYTEQNITYEKTNIYFYKLNAILVASVLEDLTEEIFVTKEMRNELAEYLLGVEKWRYYEVVLFGNSMRALTTDMLKIVTTELMKSPVLSVQIAKSKQMRIQILYNVALTMIEKKELDFAKLLIEETRSSLEKDETLILERIKLHYLNGYYMFKSGKTEAGKQLMKESINTFQLYNCVHLAQNFEAHYKASIQ